MYPEAETISELIAQANHIVIIQPDNPDGDSLGSALALEQILAKLDKETTLFCGVIIPTYLHYFAGWDRVEAELPAKFDLSLIVDTSTLTLLENLTKQSATAALAKKPAIILDHHAISGNIEFAKVKLNVADASATAEVIYELARQLNWEIPLSAMKPIASAILSDTLGLTAGSVSARTVHIIAELIEAGVSLSELENERRDTIRKSPEIVRYKGELLQRIEYFSNDRISLLTIPWEEIEKYSTQYNPPMLALDDMRLTTNTQVAVALKLYPEGKVTAKIRTNFGYPIANKLAEKFGGGGHEYAAGFKLLNNSDLAKLKQDIINYAQELLDAIV